MLVNMAVWHPAERGDHQYLCLHAGALQHHAFRSLPSLLFDGWESAKLIPFLKSSRRPWEVTGSGRGALRPLTVASCRAPSQKPWLLLFWSLSAPAHVTSPVNRALPGPQKPEECFKSLPWPHSRARRHRGPRPLSRNSTLRFSRLPFSLTLQRLALLL